ncbi:MAG: hypothetical protein C0404_13185, partial [Verrucomicrobia bacterium]|nr:hypothetical protein [Verrucomicrobiota bacterium]
MAGASGRTGTVLKITWPLDQTVFPIDMAGPVFSWEDAGGADAWRVTVGSGKDLFQSELLNTPQWIPSQGRWQEIKQSFVEKEFPVVIAGMRRGRPERILSSGRVTVRISGDEVGAPIFYREVNLPFSEAVKDSTRIRWRMGGVDSGRQPPVILENLPVCGNCHSFSADGSVMGMDVDYANDKGSYAIVPVGKETVLADENVITWSDYRREDGEQTFGLLSQVSPDGRYVVSTVKDRSVFVPRPDLEFSQLFFPVKGILAVYDRQTKAFRPLAGADDPKFVQSNPAWSPDGQYIVFARSEAFEIKGAGKQALLTTNQCREFLSGEREFLFDLYRVPFNKGEGGKAEPVEGASRNGKSNFFPKFSPDGRWIVFCKAKSFMLLQPDSELYIIPGAGGEARRLRCNTGRMNSWHSWSPNGRWLVFSSKAAGPYTQLFLTHMDQKGDSSPPVRLEHFTSPDRAANIPEFVAAAPDAIREIRPRFLNDVSFFRAGDAFLRAGDVDGARAAYEKVLGINPRNVEAQYNLGFILCGLGETDKGIEYYRKALELDPGMISARRNLGLALEKQKRFEEALAHYNKILELMPRDVTNHLSAARCLSAQGRRAEAVAHCRKAVEVAPESVLVIHQLGTALCENGEMEQGIEQLRKVLTIDPRRADVHADLGQAFTRQKKFDEARSQFKKSLELNPQDARTYALAADCLCLQGLYEEELNYRRKAVEIAPDLPAPRLAL